MILDTLADVADIIMGQSPPSSSYNQEGLGLPFFQGKADFGDLYPKVRVFCSAPGKIAQPGDILISVRAPVGPTNISPQKSCIGRGLAAIRCRAAIDRNYLLYFLRFYEPQLAQVGTGSTFEAISRDDLEQLPVPLVPLPEQKRIAAILDKADRLRRLRRYALQLSDTYLQSVFLQMFGDPVTNPMGWNVETLGSKITFMTSGSRGWAAYYKDKGAPFLRIQNVGKNQLLLDDLAYVQAPDNAEAQRTRVKSGDLLISVTADLGRTAVIPPNFPTAYINQHLVLIRLEGLNPVFVAGVLTTPGGKAQIERLDREGVKSGLNFDDVRGLRIPMPPLPLQQQFAQIVRKYERLRGQQREAERQAEHLFQTLLHRAFRGELGAGAEDVSEAATRVGSSGLAPGGDGLGERAAVEVLRQARLPLD